jgi:antitoxin YefM
VSSLGPFPLIGAQVTPMIQEGNYADMLSEEWGKLVNDPPLSRRPLFTLYRTLCIYALMHAISYTEARNNLKSVIDRVIADCDPVTIVRQRGPSAVLVSESEWNSLQETLYLLSSPKNAERLLSAIARLNAGEGEEHELIDA